ncbi:MAG: hypothetical protein NVS1B7_7230 [Candidatus Saccharimonadales bacterium]
MSSNLQSQLKYDKEKQNYEFNYESRKTESPTSSTGKPFDPASFNPFKQQVGGDAKGVKETYSFDLPADLSKGSSVYDTNLGLSFQMVPQFKVGAAKNTDGHLIYPVTNGQVIYSPKTNGLKEDIVLTRSHGDSVEYDYQLKLPEELEAKLMPDGGIGVYSVDPALFGNITFGTNGDQEKVMSARKKGTKDNLVFAIPPPTIKQATKQTNKTSTVKTGAKNNDGSGSRKGNRKDKPSVVYMSTLAPQPAQAWFTLDHNTIKLKAKGLSNLSYPLTIDPSVVVNTTAGFALGNNEGSIDYPANQVNRGALTGGTVGAWTATTSFTTARQLQRSVTYNNYMYIVGGQHVTSDTACNVSASLYCSDVQFAPINANGTLGAWTATTSLPTPRSAHGLVTYNGFMYVLGGGNTAQLNDVQYAPINANGTLGAWTATTSFTTARNEHGALAINNFMYVLGGYGTATLNDVQYAPINANGTLGAWTATTSFTTAREKLTVAAYNGYMYTIGGSNLTTYYSDVQYAPINANGTTGTWVNTAALITARNFATTVFSNGIVYVIGGFHGTSDTACTAAANNYCSDTEYAQIFANGQLSGWSKTNQFNVPRSSESSAVYNGYVYVLGGNHVATDTACNIAPDANCSDVQFTKIDSVGTIGGWKPASTTLIALHGVASVAYQNHLYKMGGVDIKPDPTGNYYSTVEVAVINQDGSLGPWVVTTGFVQGVNGLQAVAYNGYLYHMGGEFYDANTLIDNWYNIVEYAPINSADGTVGAWTATTGFTTGRAFFQATTYNGFIYTIGGYSGTAYLNDVQYAPIATNGTIGAWTATTSFAVPRDHHASVIHNNILYVTGGRHATSDTACTAIASLYCSDVQYATVNANGTIGAWTATTSFTTTRSGHGVYANKKFLYIVGGYNGTDQGDAQYAPINANGSVGTWTATTGYSPALSEFGFASYNDTLYIVNGAPGGPSGTGTVNVSYSQINYGGSGAISGWTAGPAFSTARWTHASVLYNGYIYIIAGYHPTADTLCGVVVDTACDDVQFAKLNNDGTVGAWTATSRITNRRRGLGAFAYNGYLYMGGGSSFAYFNDIQYAKQNADGSLGAWTATTSFNIGRDNLTLGTYNGYAYMAGGNHGGAGDTLCNPVSSPYCADVQYAPINANGTLGAWTRTTDLPSGRNAHQTRIYNGYFYVMGGTAAANIGDVAFAPINANGSLGAFTQTTPMPFAGYQFGALTYNGYMYIFGGHTTTDLQLDYYAPIYNNGTIGDWQQTTQLIGVRSAMTMEQYNGKFYEIGGVALGGGQSDIEATNVNVIPRVGNYTQLVDIGSPGTLQSLAVSATGNGTLALKYQTACPVNGYVYATGTAFYPWQKKSFGTTNAASNNARKINYSLNLDDSNIGVFPDTSLTSVSNVTFTYTALPPPGVNPAVRLYLGKFFSNQILQPLDTTKATGTGGGSC